MSPTEDFLLKHFDILSSLPAMTAFIAEPIVLFD
jgi:hypothetical protein